MLEASLARAAQVLLLPVAGQSHDQRSRGAAPTAQPAGDLVAIQPGQANVEQDGLGVEGGGDPQRFPALVRDLDPRRQVLSRGQEAWSACACCQPCPPRYTARRQAVQASSSGGASYGWQPAAALARPSLGARKR
jgi:hypothetical protein